MYNRCLLFSLVLLLCCHRVAGQATGALVKSNGKLSVSTAEKKGFWVKKGDALMRQQQFTAAYSAYLLAKSLGASGMSDKMQNAQQQNIRQLQANDEQLRANATRLLFQAGLQQAENMADTNLTQSLRLLELLRNTYHDSTGQNEAAVLRAVSNVVTNSEQGLYKTNQPQPDVNYDSVENARLQAAKITVATDSLPTALRQQVDSVFRRITVPNTNTIVLTKEGVMDGTIQVPVYQRGEYQFMATQQILFTFVTHFSAYYGLPAERDSLNSVILWRTDGNRLTRLHTFRTSFANTPYCSSDGRLLAAKLNVNLNQPDSLWRVANTRLIGLDEFAGERSTKAAIWFSPDSRYVIANRGGADGQGLIWRIVNTEMHYMLSIDGDVVSARFEGETVTMEVRHEQERPRRYAITSLTIDLKTHQAILPLACRYPTKATDVYFAGDNNLMVQYLAKKPRIVLYSIQDWLLTWNGVAFDGDFTGGSMTQNGRYVVLRPRSITLPAELWMADSTGRFRRVPGAALPASFENAIFSPNSRFALISNGKSPGQLRLLDGAGLRVVHTFIQPFSATDCQFSPDGRWLFVDFADNDRDSLWQVTADGLRAATFLSSMSKETIARFLPDSKQMVSTFLGNRAMFYYELEADGVRINEKYQTNLPGVNALYVSGDQVVYSTANTYLADHRQKDKSGTMPADKLSNGALVSPVFDDGETLFFVVYSDLSHRQTLVGYDKKLRQTVMSRDVNGAFDLTMTTDKNIRLADPTGLHTLVPPRRILRLLQAGEVAPLRNELCETFSPMKP